MSKNWYLTIILLFLCSNLLPAQVPPAWGGGADQNDLSFGFSFTYISSNFKIVKKPGWRNRYFDPGVNPYIADSLSSISSTPLPGFAIGFITRYRITDHLEARVTPALVFADRSLTYTYPTASADVTKSIQTTTVDFPISLTLKSDRIDNFRAYLMGGLKYSVAIGKGNNDTADLNPLDQVPKNVAGFGSYEVGLGFDIYFEFFKLSPEIKLSNSIGNVLVSGDNPYSTPISKLTLHTISFSLIFE
ncbi:MAG TPA: porin [Mucilaginibacter sp.]|jgi:hypothetical protein|nr:porin [Mucilaginibacter sp.]